MNNFENNLNFFANMLQIMSYNILLHDFNNHDLMEYLKHQDELLNKVISQNEEIVALLKGGKNDKKLY